MSMIKFMGHAKANDPVQRTQVLANGDPNIPSSSLFGGRISQSKSPMFSERTNEINASDKTDILRQLESLQHQVRAGAVKSTVTLENEYRNQIEAQMRKAAADNSGHEFMVLAEMYGEAVWTYGSRLGMARNLLLIQNPGPKEVGKIKVYRKNTTIYMATGPTTVQPSYCQQDWVYPAEFTLQGLVLIPEHELATAGPEFMEEKMNDGLESHMVREDRILRALAVNSAAIENTVIAFNTFNPATLLSIQNQPGTYGHPVTSIYIAHNLWPSMITNSDFVALWDPATARELLMEGSLGRLLGASMFTDGFRDARLQVMAEGEVLCFADPAHLGGLVQRQELAVHQTDRYALGESTKGIFMNQILGMAVGNCRGVARGFSL